MRFLYNVLFQFKLNDLNQLFQTSLSASRLFDDMTSDEETNTKFISFCKFPYYTYLLRIITLNGLILYNIKHI